MDYQFSLIEGVGIRRSVPLSLATCLSGFPPGPSFKEN